ncbi:unnamed protein product [Sphagnum tenellum]
MSHGEARVGSSGVPEVQLEVDPAIPEVQSEVAQNKVLILKVPRYMREPPDQFTPIEWRLGLHNREITSAAEDLKTSIREAFVLANEAPWNDFCDDVVDHIYRVSLLRLYGLDHPPNPFNEVEVKSSLVLDALVLIVRLAQPPRDELGELERQQFEQYFRSTYPKDKLADTLGNCAHILDCVYHVLCGPTFFSKRAYVQDIVHIQCATNLKATGIQIKAVAGPLEKLSFEHRCLCVPAITISQITEVLFRNLAVHEDMNLEMSSYEFSAYLQLMKNLISGPEDMKLLVNCGVIVNFLGNEAEVCEAWNRLTRDLWFDGQSQSIHLIAEAINQHCNSRNPQKTEIYERFCSRPWYVISIIAATLITLGTCIQTYIAVIGSDRMGPHFPPR